MEHKKQQHSGLTDAEVLKSREQHGSNILTPPKKEPLWKLFLEKFEDPIIRILLIAAILSLFISIIHNEYLETIGIFCAIFLATGVAFWFERDASKKFDVLNQVNDEDTLLVMRNGNVTQVPKKDIVVGDIVVLETGNEVPADGVLLEAIALEIDESTLTGEPIIDKTTDPEHFEEGVTYPSNHVLRSTKVVNGHGIFEVKKVGDSTEFGKVASKATEKVEGMTPLNRQLDGLAKFIGLAGFSLALFTFAVLFLKIVLFDPEVGEIKKRQIFLLLAVIGGMGLALAKVWLPLILDGLSLFNKKLHVTSKLIQRSWFLWIFFGFLFATSIIGTGAIMGVDPLNPDSWVSIEVAGKVLQAFMVAVTLVVVAVPEGLPMSVTLSLALSMRRMLKSNNLVRKMHACETMGATTVICTDKTGTLTQNQMRVYRTNIYALQTPDKLDDSEVSKLMIESLAVNSTAFLDHSDKDNLQVLGNPTEGALLLWLNDQGIDYQSIRDGVHVIDELPFNTQRKVMGTSVDSPTLAKKILYLKGAPEVVLARCANVLTETGNDDVKKFQTSIEEQLLRYQEQAMRTLGFAYKVLDAGETRNCEELSAEGMTFIGVAAISDPVRVDVPDAVQKCLGAGIGVKIVTGDTYGTAKEIGRQIGIWDDAVNQESHIITGPNFEALTDEEAAKMVKDLRIMCRARPTDKQRLVHLLKEVGEVVAVTGDGTNDAPALNYADVGLSMGTGTSVAKEASDITLLDDSFASIATAVMWGRSLYQNIQRFLLFQLTINVAALLIVFLGSIFGHDLPLTVTQMLWVNLIMDTFAAGALASLPPNPNVMDDKPRKNSDFIIKPVIARQIIITGLCFVAFLLGVMWYFSTPDHLDQFFHSIAESERSDYFLSYFFTVFVMLQFWNMFNAKAYASGKSAFADFKESGAFWLVAGIILVGQITIVTIGGEVFRTMPLLLKDWLVIIGGTSVVLWAGEIVRFIKRKLSK